MSDRFKKFVAKLKQLTTLCLVVRCSNLCCVFVEIGGGAPPTPPPTPPPPPPRPPAAPPPPPARIPVSGDEFQENYLRRAEKETKHFLIFLFSCIAWSLWLIRNDFVFNNNVVGPSHDVGVFPLISFMQRWAHFEEGGWTEQDRTGGSSFEVTNAVLAV
jgi:hypothetical protein